jgi:hypothetical protein
MMTRTEGTATGRAAIFPGEHLRQTANLGVIFELNHLIRTLRSGKDLIERDVTTAVDKRTMSGVEQHNARRGPLIRDLVRTRTRLREEMLR